MKLTLISLKKLNNNFLRNNGVRISACDFCCKEQPNTQHNRCIWHNVVTIILRSDYFRDETFRVKTGIFLFAFISIDWIVVSWYSFTNKKKLQVRVIGMQMNKITHSITFLQFNRRYRYTYELIFSFFQTIESDRQD